MHTQMLTTVQTINSLLTLQQSMRMSDTPKQLSDNPQAICFQVSISDFIPANVTITKPVFGCIFSDQVAMNSALLRAGLFVHTQLGMADDQELFSSNLMSAVGGHDFNGEELFNYYRQAIIPDQSAPEHLTLKAIERDFREKVILPIIRNNKENFVFFAIINTKKFKANLSHELLHAQYYNVPQIQKVLLQVWQQVPENDQKAIKDCLQNAGYDMRQQELLLREFYSYFLQYNAQAYMTGLKQLKPIADFVPVYAPKITDAFAAANLRVLELSQD